MMYPRTLLGLGVFVPLAGILYYLTVPVLFAEYFHARRFPLSDRIVDYLQQIDITAYFVFIALYYVAFLLGFLCVKSRAQPFPVQAKPEPDALFYALLALLAVLAGYAMFGLRHVAFTGYMEIAGVERDNKKSLLAGLNLVYIFLAVHTFLARQKRAFRVVMLVLLINSVFLVGLGVRMYVLPALLCAAFVYLARTRIRILNKRVFSLLMLIPAVLMLILLVGVLRSGKDLTGADLFYVLFAECNFSWLGVGSFLTHNQIQALEFPRGYLVAFIGLVPTLFWPEKHAFMQSIESPYFIWNPVGGTSIVYTALTNFGLFGSFVFFFFLGVVLRVVLTRARSSVFWLAYYFCLLSLMPFMFFRDNANIFVKASLFTLLLIPFIFLKLLPAVTASSLGRKVGSSMNRH
jgi:oligosaccharide repeat unit polymerase